MIYVTRKSLNPSVARTNILDFCMLSDFYSLMPSITQMSTVYICSEYISIPWQECDSYLVRYKFYEWSTGLVRMNVKHKHGKRYFVDSHNQCIYGEHIKSLTLIMSDFTVCRKHTIVLAIRLWMCAVQRTLYSSIFIHRHYVCVCMLSMQHTKESYRHATVYDIIGIVLS